VTSPDALQAATEYQSWRDKAAAEASKSSPSATKVQAYAAVATLFLVEYQLKAAGAAADAVTFPPETP
jgi:hypothetical protein